MDNNDPSTKGKAIWDDGAEVWVSKGDPKNFDGNTWTLDLI